MRRRWDREAAGYDQVFTAAERRMFPGLRRRVCALAEGRTLEIAVGTGLNLEHYPPAVIDGTRPGGFVGVDQSAGMLDVARRRAAGLGLGIDPDADLRRGDAQALDLPDDSFDTVVCTFSLCGIGDDRAALAEMTRVLRPGGLLLLADHVASSVWPLRALQALADVVSVPLAGEHFGRRPMRWVLAQGLAIEEHERTRAGVVEHVAARLPGVRPGADVSR
ncbi:Ubiquinone/menaquinone biosynthesis C-methylase UbiE [Krasilnikoviella flava]|uniref:Ubiquinone/menaquinone biosynthesis C-methylase UbiE n=1 Tax=Krasilnikoviella flava TaxID=526729 RepID=A0A1T5L4R4_9MICO|nr:Ubiquinone/menaquinone biosynthesis C-methylase UbiE [Krasilnikoviella flava]